MKRCADSTSVEKLSVLGQLLWHRLIHDGGLDAWGVARGEPRRVAADCLLTVPYDLAEVSEQLDIMVDLGMLHRYEHDGAVLIAALKFHEHQSWRRRCGVPTLPWDQTVADHRELERLDESPARRAANGKLDRLMKWAVELGLEVSLDGVSSLGTACDPDGNATGTQSEPVGTVRCTDFDVDLELDVEGGKSAHPLSLHPLTPRATAKYEAVGITPDDAYAAMDLAASSSACEDDARVYPLAIILEALERSSWPSEPYKDRPRALALRKLRDGDLAERAYITRAKRLLTVKKPPTAQVALDVEVPESCDRRVAYRCADPSCRARHNGGLIALVETGQEPGECTCGAQLVPVADREEGERDE